MDRAMDMDQQPPRSVRPGAIAAGAILLTVGVAMFLDSTGAVDVRLGRLIGPLVLIALGSSILLEKGTAIRIGRRAIDATDEERPGPRKRGDGNSGLWLIGIGLWMMVSQLNLFGLHYGNSWPILIIMSGIMIVIRGVR
jgi:hypothetical protein